jgi:hypothetical protein
LSERRVSRDRALAESRLLSQLSHERSIVVNAFATFQPLDFISEVAIGSAAGLTYDPPAKALYGVSAHYRF